MKNQECIFTKIDSDKTSWFYPFQGIIPQKYVSGVARDGKFSAQLVNAHTQVVFMDEWTSDSLCCEDAKKLLQGGLVMIQQKHKAPSTFQYNSGFFITTNIYPDFGEGRDGEAIRKRLAIFNTKALPKKDIQVSGWLRINCMEIFHYLAIKLKDTPNFESGNLLPNNRMGAIYNDFETNTSNVLGEMREFSFSYSQCSAVDIDSSVDMSTFVPQHQVDKAIIESDERGDNTLYEYLSFDHDLADYTSRSTDYDYLRKVYEICCDEWKVIMEQITTETLEIYERKHRIDWKGADSVFDAWLLSNNYRRSWFPYDEFIKHFPDWERVRIRIVKELESEDESVCEEEVNIPKRKKRKLIIDSTSELESDKEFEDYLFSKSSEGDLLFKPSQNNADAETKVFVTNYINESKKTSEVISISSSSEDDTKPFENERFAAKHSLSTIITISDSD